MITFTWEKGTAASAMYKKMRDLGFTINYRYFAPFIIINGQEVFLDYKHITKNTYEIVQKISQYRQEPIYKSIEL